VALGGRRTDAPAAAAASFPRPDARPQRTPATKMRKKVDSRIRTLVENCVQLRQRGLFVIIGDKGRDQVSWPAPVLRTGHPGTAAPQARRSRCHRPRSPGRRHDQLHPPCPLLAASHLPGAPGSETNHPT
jgi:hypothetical protein